MNHCVLEVEVIQAPTVRYTQENQMPIAEVEVRFDALRPNDLPGELKKICAFILGYFLDFFVNENIK